MTSFLSNAGKLLHLAITVRYFSSNKWKPHLEAKMKIFHNKNNCNLNNNNNSNQKKLKRRYERDDSREQKQQDCQISRPSCRKEANEKYRQYRRFQRRHKRRAAILRKIYRHYLSRKTQKPKRSKSGPITSENHLNPNEVTRNPRAKGGKNHASRMEKGPVDQFSRTKLSAGATGAKKNPKREILLGRSEHSQLPKKRPIWFITGGFKS